MNHYPARRFHPTLFGLERARPRPSHIVEVPRSTALLALACAFTGGACLALYAGLIFFP